MPQRAKLSTTVAPETMDFLEKKVKAGEASTLAEALDAAIAALRRLENRRRLSRATSDYFADTRSAAADNALAADLASASGSVDFDSEL